MDTHTLPSIRQSLVTVEDADQGNGECYMPGMETAMWVSAKPDVGNAEPHILATEISSNLFCERCPDCSEALVIGVQADREIQVLDRKA